MSCAWPPRRDVTSRSRTTARPLASTHAAAGPRLAHSAFPANLTAPWGSAASPSPPSSSRRASPGSSRHTSVLERVTAATATDSGRGRRAVTAGVPLRASSVGGVGATCTVPETRMASSTSSDSDTSSADCAPSITRTAFAAPTPAPTPAAVLPRVLPPAAAPATRGRGSAGGGSETLRLRARVAVASGAAGASAPPESDPRRVAMTRSAAEPRSDSGVSQTHTQPPRRPGLRTVTTRVASTPVATLPKSTSPGPSRRNAPPTPRTGTFTVV